MKDYNIYKVLTEAVKRVNASENLPRVGERGFEPSLSRQLADMFFKEFNNIVSDVTKGITLDYYTSDGYSGCNIYMREENYQEFVFIRLDIREINHRAKIRNAIIKKTALDSSDMLLKNIEYVREKNEEYRKALEKQKEKEREEDIYFLNRNGFESVEHFAKVYTCMLQIHDALFDDVKREVKEIVNKRMQEYKKKLEKEEI